MSKITTHPAGWRIRRSSPKEGQKKSNSLLLPTRPGMQDMLISTVAVKNLMRYSSPAGKVMPEIANDLLQAITEFENKNKGQSFTILHGIGRDAAQTLTEWDQEMGNAWKEYTGSIKEKAEEVPEPAPEEPPAREKAYPIAVAKESVHQALQCVYKAIEVLAVCNIRKRRKAEDIAVAIEEWLEL